MADTFFPGQALAMTVQTADRLFKLDSGDAALLYLYLLRHGGTAGLKWPDARLREALEGLRSLGLAPGEVPPAPEPPAPEPPPEYSIEDITQALADESSIFPALAGEVERRLGKRLCPPTCMVLPRCRSTIHCLCAAAEYKRSDRRAAGSVPKKA